MNLVKQKKQTVIIITALFLLAVSLFTFLQPLRYSAASRLLVVQNYGPNTDAYNISRSNQFISNLLAQVVYSDSFYDQVMASGYKINRNIFSSEVNKRKKQWQSLVSTRAIADTGMIVLKTYYQDRHTADLINQAIGYTLMTKNSQYHGLGDSVKVKLIDNSALSDWPVKPNMVLNLLLGLIAGLAASLYYIYLFPNQAGRAVEPMLEAEAEPAIAYRPARTAPVYTPSRAMEPAEENFPAAPAVEQDIEQAGDDEFEAYFKGDINNVLQK